MDKVKRPPMPNPQPKPPVEKCDEPEYGATMYGDVCTNKDNKSRCQLCTGMCF